MIHHSIDNPRNEDDADEGARQRDDLKRFRRFRRLMQHSNGTLASHYLSAD